MEGTRCFVESLAEFGCPCGSKKVLSLGTDVLLSNGSKLVFRYGNQERRVVAIHELPSLVTHLELSLDKQVLYTLCEGDGIYALPLEQQTRSSSHLGAILPLKVSPECCAVKDGDIATFLVAHGVLVTAGLRGDVWRFRFYQAPVLPTTAVHKLAERCVPATAESRARPVLCCVSPPCQAAGGLQKDNGGALLDLDLFSQLFGVDASLASSPLVLCGLPDGRLYCLPFLVSKGSPKVLHHVDQPVAFIGTPHGCSSVLLVVGHLGKVLMMRVEEREGAKELGFLEHRVTGPIECICISDTHLYYSTTSELLALPLFLPGSPGPNQRLDSGSALYNQLSLGVCGVAALAQPIKNGAGAARLMGLSVRGRLLRITLPQKTNPGHISRLRPAQAGQRIKDLLGGIANVADRASVLKRKTQLQNETLKRLNHVFNICCLLLPSRDNREECLLSSQPISFHLKARLASLLREPSFTLDCVLKNASSCSLLEGWTLSVQVGPSGWAWIPEEHSSIHTFSFPLRRLDPGQSWEMVLPLAAGKQPFLPVEVRCWLVYSLHSMLGLLDGPHLVDKAADTRCISLALGSSTVDLLDCLLTDSAKVHEQISSSGSPAELVQVFLNNRRVQPDGPNVVVPVGGLSVASLRVSSELLRAALRPPDPSSQSLCNVVLSWLVTTSPTTSDQEDADCVFVCVRSFWGDHLKLTAQEIPGMVMSAEGPVSGVELQVEASSMGAMCALHCAVLHRVTTLLKSSNAEFKGPTLLEGQSLGQALEHVEDLCKAVQDACGGATLGARMSKETTEKLFHIYMRMRKNPLIIL